MFACVLACLCFCCCLPSLPCCFAKCICCGVCFPVRSCLFFSPVCSFFVHPPLTTCYVLWTLVRFVFPAPVPSRKGCVVNGQITKASSKWARRRHPPSCPNVGIYFGLWLWCSELSCAFADCMCVLLYALHDWMC